MGANFGDLDNDGFLDFYLGTGAPSFATLVPNCMFRNDGGRRFLDVTDATRHRAPAEGPRHRVRATSTTTATRTWC